MPAESLTSTSGYGAAIKAARQARGLNQRELAKVLGIAPLVLSKIERGELLPMDSVVVRLREEFALPELELAELADDTTRRSAPRSAAADTDTRAMAAADHIATTVRGSATRGELQTPESVKRGYVFREQIGQGGFGAVYRAEQASIGRDVAVKVVRPELANDADFIRRFEMEARLVARLEHPHIVPLYDFWREPGAAFMVMRYLRGGSLADRLARADASEYPLKLLNLINQIGQALHTAHQAGIVHRDLKPANILLDEQGNACLADFGIAKQLAGDGGGTQIGEIVGSIAYCSPEQLRGEQISAATDVYSFGLLCFELVTGRRPFEATPSAALMQQQLFEEAPSAREFMPDLPLALAAALAHALQKLPEKRPANVLALISEIDTAVREGLASGWAGKVAHGHSLALSESRAPTALTSLQFADADNPYVGLSAFGEGDARNFFGRETLIEQLLAKLAERSAFSRALVVIGPSGSGKSSVVRAGLIPALRAGAIPGSKLWLIADLLPGTDPLKALAQALARVSVREDLNLEDLIRSDVYGLSRAIDRCLPSEPGCELLLIVDQFEELFTLTADESARLAFISAITTAILDPYSRVRMVFTLRADFLDRPLQYPDLGEILRERTAMVPSMSLDELERAIVGPARRLGMRFEDGLVAAMLAEISSQVGALPLLQYALSELFLRRHDGTLKLAEFRAFGGIRGALAGRAETAYRNLDAAGQHAAQQLFLRLTTLGEGSEDTRRRTLASELLALCSNAIDPVLAGRAQAAAISAFAAERLLTFDRDATSAERTLEVAHEALLRSWTRLREWLATARADMRLQRQLAQAAAEWRESGNDASFLLRGNRLSQIQPLAKGELVALSRDESQFLDASLHAVAAREQHERDRADRELNQARELAAEQQRAAANERRGNRRLRVLVLGLAGILVVSVWQGLQLKARSNDLAQQTERANQEAKSAGSLSEFWAQLFATADPNLSRGKGRDLTVVEVLDVGLGRVQSDLKDSPLAQARLLLTMGRSFRQLAAYDKAQLALDQAQVAIASAPNAPDTERIDLLLERGRLFADRLEFEAALNELRQAQSLQVSSNAPPLSRATTLNIIASIYNDQLKLGDAEPLLRETLQLRRKHGASQAEIAGSLNNLAFTLLQLGYPREARELFLEGAQLREKLQTEPSLDAALMRMNVGVADRDLGQFDSAAKQFAQTRISLTQLVGSQDGSAASHPTLAALLLHESAAQSLQGRYETALERMESAVAMMTALSGGNVDAPGLLSHRRERGRLQLLLGRIDEAEKDLKFACGLVQERFGPKSMPWGNCQSRMGEVELAKGNRELAGTRLEEAIEILSTRDERDLRNGIELARALLLRIELDPARAAADRPRAFALLDSAKELARARQVLEKIK